MAKIPKIKKRGIQHSWPLTVNLGSSPIYAPYAGRICQSVSHTKLHYLWAGLFTLDKRGEKKSKWGENRKHFKWINFGDLCVKCFRSTGVILLETIFYIQL